MEDVKTHFLYPSSLFASNEPHIVSTILLLCCGLPVDATTKNCSINHYMSVLNGQDWPVQSTAILP